MAPPRKRARASPASASIPSTPASTIAPATAPSITTSEADGLLLADPWTPDQTTALFKAMIRAKPTGVHRHMHMLQISQTVQTQTSGSYEHLRIPGIWRKLAGLYELDALNEREEHFARIKLMEERQEAKKKQEQELPEKAKSAIGPKRKQAEPRKLTEAEEDLELGREFWPEFKVDDIEEEMWQRRLKSETDDPSDEEQGQGASTAQSGRGRGNRRGRGGRPSGGTVKQDSEEDERGGEEDVGESEEEADEDEGEEEPEGQGSTNASSPVPARGTRSTTTRSTASVRGNRGKERGGRRR